MKCKLHKAPKCKSCGKGKRKMPERGQRAKTNKAKKNAY